MSSVNKSHTKHYYIVSIPKYIYFFFAKNQGIDINILRIVHQMKSLKYVF